MMSLLEIRQHLKVFYREYERILSKIIRFLFSFLVFYLVNLNTGFNETLQNPLISIFLALVCAMVPSGAISPVMCVCLLVQFYFVSGEMAAAAFCVFLIMLFMYYVFKGGNSWIMALTVLLCIMKVPGILIIALGLMASPIVVVPAGFGILIFRMIEMMKTEYGTLFSQTEGLSSLQKVTWFFQQLFQDETKLLLLAAAVITVLLVYAIRRLSIDYSWAIAISVGTISYLLVMLLGNFALDIHVDIGLTLLNALGGVLVSAILYLFVFAVDYTRTEYVQFEDEDYYYYVKAVPKISVAVQDKKVKHITEKAKDALSESE